MDEDYSVSAEVSVEVENEELIDNVIEKLKTFSIVEDVIQAGVNEATTQFSSPSLKYAGNNDVLITSDVTSEDFNQKGTVTASGESVTFIEFGTGVSNEGSEYASEHNVPVHGTYGKGQGQHKGWVYPASNGLGTTGTLVKNREDLVYTTGNPANRCMYHTQEVMKDKIDKSIKEFFKND